MKDLIKGTALLLGGAMLGAAAALLLTPKTGEEVRKEIKDLAEEAKKQVQDYCDKVKQDLVEVKAEVKKQPKAKKA